MLEIFPWEDRYSVGVAVIDAQHRKLVAMINELHTEMTGDAGEEALRGIVNGMISYAMSHFATEERYMMECDYEEFRGHKEEHDKFCEKTTDLSERVNRGGVVLSLEVVMFLRDWLTHHIMETDKKYAPCFRRIGLE